MKKFLVASAASLAVMMMFAGTAMANVSRPAGQTTGKPVSAYSNSGSVSGQTHRSATGTAMKELHDGPIAIW